MSKPTIRGLAATACAMGLLVLTAACGSSSSPSSQGTSSQDKTGIEEATATVAKLKSPPAFTVDPVHGAVPKGKVVAQVNCTIPVCTPGAMEEPVKALGWTLHRFDFDITKGAQDYLRAVNAALDSKPDFLALNGNYGPEVVARQLQRAKSDGIPVVAAGGSAIDTVALMVQSPVPLQAAGAYMADVALDKARTPVHAAVPVDPSIPSLTAMADGAKKRLAEVPGSSAAVIQLSFAQPQATNVSAIINYLKSHPDTGYLLFPGSGFYAGVRQALQAGGLQDKVKLVLAYPFPSDLQAIQKGEFLAAVAGESTYQWRMVDGMARLAVGETLTNKTPSNEFRLLTSDNATAAGFDPADFKSVYKRAWGV